MSRTLVHLSDIHFGRIHEPALEPLILAIESIRPDLVVVSGDLTQRARSAEFREARAFLERLPKPQVVVPGNHDVPLYNPYGRFVEQLDKYREHISDNLTPEHVDDEVAVYGISTARSLAWKNGRVGHDQIEYLRERLLATPPDRVKVVVTHHPLDLPETYGSRHLVGRAHLAMEWLVACGADLLLAGHMHLSHSFSSARRHEVAGHPALVVQAGTAVSSRGRGEVNSFNRIVVSSQAIEVERWSWDDEAGCFAAARRESFARSGGQWVSANRL
jgi:3',5'-cyclic AMP phosphodiesterase CpdA